MDGRLPCPVLRIAAPNCTCKPKAVYVVCGLLCAVRRTCEPFVVSVKKAQHTAVLPRTPHCTCCKRVPNRPQRPHRGRFGTLLELLQWWIFGRTAVVKDCVESYILLCSYIWPIPSMSTKDQQSQTVSQPSIQLEKVDRPMGS